MKSRGKFPILKGMQVMQWLLGSVVLVAVAVLLRRILYRGATPKDGEGAAASLRAELAVIYRPVAQEIEAHTAILGITLNDAFGERDANRQEMAWHVVRLALGEWARLTEFMAGLQDILGRYLAGTNGIVPPRRIAAGRFKSREVIDYVRLYEFLDQVLFSSKQRFSLQLRVMSRANSILSKEFRRACREGERNLDSSEELWSRLDYYFHDFDLIAKETLLALHTLLVCQSPAGRQDVATDLQDLLERAVRVSIAPSNQ